MTNRSVTHHNFTTERIIAATPSQVFAAFANPEQKARWQDSPDVTAAEDADGYLEFDFRVGGHERLAFEHGHKYSYDAEYYDLVPDERIVYSYTMHADGSPDSISIVTIEFRRDGNRTALSYSEQGAFLDGIDDPAEREEGIGDLLDNLAKFLSI